jgi:hypothetical protein
MFFLNLEMVVKFEAGVICSKNGLISLSLYDETIRL